MLSVTDKQMMGVAYPKDEEMAEHIISNRISNLNYIVANEGLDENSLKRFSRQLRFLEKNKL